MALVADRFYPFAVTLDVSTAWHNLRHAQWEPLATFRRRFWGDVLVDNAVTFALFAALLRAVADRLRRIETTPAAVWTVTVAFAALLEVGKLGFEGRYPNLDNILLAAAGGLAGITFLPWVTRREPVKAHPGLALLGLAVALLAYAELTPFDFSLAPSAIAAKAARIEWLPLASYYGADPQSALFDLWNKLLLSGLLGFAVLAATGRGRREAAMAGLAVGGLLECAQVLKVTRIPSITDVLIVGVGAYLGGVAQVRYRAWRREGSSY